MIRRAITALFMALAGPALAGHYTHDQIIGFSEDGRYFAFETYGLQRGSGLPFANIFVVDMERDVWVAGSPFRIGAAESDMAAVEAAPFAALAEVRAEAGAAAASMLRDLGVIRPVTMIYAAGIGQVHDAAEVVQIAQPHPDNPTAPPMAQFGLRLTEITLPAGVDHCLATEALRGYRLERIAADGAVTTLHEDARLPASRGCAQAYRLDAVVSAGYPAADRPPVALISVWAQGFEGLERHVIATAVPGFAEAGAGPAPDPDTEIAAFLAGFDAGPAAR